eukprot:NODE_6890_length_429_cov_142.621053_g5281_i0.p2 GENE.NODE_6890_length_429_cov_142.621053_g5281_i0~~NODE_6890_length_429_cov_142.621053_g5281_i0.p2  ORF type:complete len:65 (+),score=6.17 NODE_6890_length_429_cov_142.621053_g5281_i0:67-261(+)
MVEEGLRRRPLPVKLGSVRAPTRASQEERRVGLRHGKGFATALPAVGAVQPRMAKRARTPEGGR